MKEPTKVIIYESAMCCSSGICGPNPDQTLIGFQDTLDDIIKSGAIVERYSITQNPKRFMESPQVTQLIQKKQLKALPITMLNGNIIKTGSYPTKEELQALLNTNDNIEEPTSTQTNTIDSEGCCSGKNYCDIRYSPVHSSECSGGEAKGCCS